MSRRLPEWKNVNEIADRESLQPDLARAVRSTIAYMVPVALAFGGWMSLPVSFVAIAAQNIAMVDVRGDYRIRMGLLLAMTGVFAGAAALGSWAAPNIWEAVAATVLVAVAGGVWRHLSSDYGMSLAISSTLVFLLALNPKDRSTLAPTTVAAFLGGLWGMLLQVAHWPFHPQHPLRRPVSDSWVALGDVFAGMLPRESEEPAAHQARLATEENVLRGTLEKTAFTLEHARPGPVRAQLEAIHLVAGRLATLQIVLATALENAMAEPGFDQLQPALQPLFLALKNTSRTVALTVVSGQPSHLAAAEIRLRRIGSLLQAAQGALTENSTSVSRHYFAEVLRQIEQYAPSILEALRPAVTRAGERVAFSLELFDLETWTLRPLASALNLTTKIDPALARFVLRLSLFMVGGVLVYKLGSLPHGYWLPFTIIVVLQPDYGSTRQRAAQRVAGTIAGSVVASALLWLQMPRIALASAAAFTIFMFGYLVRRNYAYAVFFVTLFIVILTEANGAITLAFTLERIGSTLAGGAVALLSALYFWPVWERERLPQILAAALRANRDYAKAVVEWLTTTGDGTLPTRARRLAESANALAFSSLQRATGDPKNRRSGLEHAATIANGNQRLTRALTVLIDQAGPGAPLSPEVLVEFNRRTEAGLEAVASEVEGNAAAIEQLARTRSQLSSPPFPLRSAPPRPARETVIAAQVTRFQAELSALVLAAEAEIKPRANRENPESPSTTALSTV